MNKKKGFSLVELLVVMAIMAIIVLLATPKYLNYTKEAKSKQILADIKTTSNKLAVFMSKNNDNLPDSSTDINSDTLAFYVNAKKIYDINGIVTNLDKEASYLILPSTFIKREAGSKLNGKFLATAGGDVYYIDENSSTTAAAISTPSIILSATSNPEQMLVTINYPKDSMIQEYKIDDGEWQTAAFESSNAKFNPFINISASEISLITKITVSIESTVYARASYLNNKTFEKNAKVNNLVLTPSTSEAVNSLTVSIEYPADAVVKEYKVEDGNWTTYTGPISIEDNVTIYAKGIDLSNKILAYGKLNITNINDSIIEYAGNQVISFTETGIKVGNASAFKEHSEALLYVHYGLGTAGKYELIRIKQIDVDNNLIIPEAYPTTITSGTGIALYPVLSGENITIAKGTTITAKAFDGTTGGVVAIKAKSLTINGIIDVSGKGYRGGSAINGVRYSNGYRGETLTGGLNVKTANANYGAGGGGLYPVNDNWILGGAGSGGANYTGGTAGWTSSTPGKAYSTWVTMSPQLAMFGSGGGGGGTDNDTTFISGAGGNGGGAIIIFADTIRGSGKIVSKGMAGGIGVRQNGAGGGGAGGTIVIHTNNPSNVDINYDVTGGPSTAWLGNSQHFSGAGGLGVVYIADNITNVFSTNTNALLGKFYKGRTFDTYVYSAPQDKFYINYGTGSPSSSLIGTDNWSAIWEGYISVPTTGIYTFELKADDNSEIYIDETMVVSCSNYAINYGTTMLEAGRKYPIKITLVECVSNAYLYLRMKAPDETTYSEIPISYLSTN